MDEYNSCTLCPRSCKVNRNLGAGICCVSSEIKVARAALHYWEEPCISGTNGSGAVFFSGCPLHCVFCQNEAISWGRQGTNITEDRLADIFIELQEQGASNINLVTGTHYAPGIRAAVSLARDRGLVIPTIYNCGGYESLDSVRQLKDTIDVYLPDFKYWDAETAMKYSHTPNYVEVAQQSIAEMVRQKPSVKFDENGLVKEGVIVRVLLLPGHVNDAKNIVDYLYYTYKDSIYISLMSQFTPTDKLKDVPELNRRVTKREYNSLVDFALNIGVTNAFIQDRHVASESFIPEFDGTGV